MNAGAQEGTVVVEPKNWKQRLKPLAAVFGIRSSEDLYRGAALRAYARKRRTDAAYRAWVDGEADRWVSRHWAHTTTTDEFHARHLTSQLYEIARTLRERMGPLGEAQVLEAGASDGFFLTRVGARRGVGLNVLEACAAQIRADGFTSCLGDLERLPFADKVFDYVICCETLEHVPNPIHALNELARVCRKRIFATVPWMSETRINARADGWPEVENHIFEFSERDLSKILSHASVRVSFRGTIEVFPEPRNPLARWWFATWMYGSFFPRLQYVELEPVARRTQRISQAAPSADQLGHVGPSSACG